MALFQLSPLWTHELATQELHDVGGMCLIPAADIGLDTGVLTQGLG
jgi:hypothetical protein